MNCLPCNRFVRFQTEETRARALELSQEGVVIEGHKLYTSLPRLVVILKNKKSVADNKPDSIAVNVIKNRCAPLANNLSFK